MMKFLLLLLGCQYLAGRMISVSEISPSAMFDATMTDRTLRFASCDGFKFDNHTLGLGSKIDKWAILDGYFCPHDCVGDCSSSTTTTTTTTSTGGDHPSCGLGGLLGGPFAGLVTNKTVSGSLVDPLEALGLQDGILDAILGSGSDMTMTDISLTSICKGDNTDGALVNGFGFHEFGLQDLVLGKSALWTFLVGIKECLFWNKFGHPTETTTADPGTTTTTTTTTCTSDCDIHVCDNLLAKKAWIFKGSFTRDDIISDSNMSSVILSRLFPDDFNFEKASGAVRARKFLAAGNARCSTNDCVSWTDKFDPVAAKLLLKGLTVLKVGAGVTIVLSCALADKTLEKLFRAVHAAHFAISAVIAVKQKFKAAALHAISTSHMLLVEQLAAKCAIISFAKDIKTCFQCAQPGDDSNSRQGTSPHHLIAANESLRFAQTLGWLDTSQGLFDGETSVLPDLANPIPDLQALDLLQAGSSKRHIKRYVLQRM